MRFRTKVLIVLAITAVAAVVEQYFFATSHPTMMTDIALDQMKDGMDADKTMETLRWYDLAKNYIVAIAFVGSSLVCFWDDIWAWGCAACCVVFNK